MTGRKVRYKKVFFRLWTGTRSWEKEKLVSLLENDSEKKSSSLSRQSSETKPNIKLVLKLFHCKNPLLCLEFNNPYKQNVYEINLFKNFNFSQSQNNNVYTNSELPTPITCKSGGFEKKPRKTWRLGPQTWRLQTCASIICDPLVVGRIMCAPRHGFLGGGTPLYGLYRLYVRPQRVWFFGCFGHK